MPTEPLTHPLPNWYQEGDFLDIPERVNRMANLHLHELPEPAREKVRCMLYRYAELLELEQARTIMAELEGRMEWPVRRHLLRLLKERG